jgi:hypothetical protein
MTCKALLFQVYKLVKQIATTPHKLIKSWALMTIFIKCEVGSNAVVFALLVSQKGVL